LKRDKLLKAIESSDSKNDSNSVISPRKKTSRKSPLINLIDSSSNQDPSISNSNTLSENMSDNYSNSEFCDFTCKHDNDDNDVVDDGDEKSNTAHTSVIVHTEFTHYQNLLTNIDQK